MHHPLCHIAPTSFTPYCYPLPSQREDRPEVNHHTSEEVRADYGFVATMVTGRSGCPREIFGYGFHEIRSKMRLFDLQGAPVSTDTELGAHVREFESMTKGQCTTAFLMETEARMLSGLGKGKSMDAKDRISGGVMEMRELMAADVSFSSMHLFRIDDVWQYRGRLTTVTRRQQDPLGVCTARAAEEEDIGVSAALAARDATRNGVDSHTSGTGVRGSERVARKCTYQDFMKCKPLYFKGTERSASALTWWNSHVMTVTHDVAYSMTWVDLRKKMTDKYCPRNEMKKLEAELWNLKVIGVLGNANFTLTTEGTWIESERTTCFEVRLHASKVYVGWKCGRANPDNVIAGAPILALLKEAKDFIALCDASKKALWRCVDADEKK
ncbi:putative reverse transcriptase domain-containing protein [Tanacetum coccineum]